MKKLLTGILGLTIGLNITACDDLDYEDTDPSIIEERGLITIMCRERQGNPCTTDKGGPGEWGPEYDEKAGDCQCHPLSSEPHPDCGPNQTCGEPA